MIKIEINGEKARIETAFEKDETAVETIAAICALGQMFQEESAEDFKKLLVNLAQDENSPLNNPDRYREEL